MRSILLLAWECPSIQLSHTSFWPFSIEGIRLFQGWSSDDVCHVVPRFQVCAQNLNENKLRQCIRALIIPQDNYVTIKSVCLLEATMATYVYKHSASDLP